MTEELEGEEGRHELTSIAYLCQAAGAGSPHGPGLSVWQEVCPCPFSWHPGQAVLCSAQRGSTNGPRVKHQAGRKQLQGTTANSSL